MTDMLQIAADDQYVDWLEEVEQVHIAYERWQAADVDDRALAYASYRTALEREQRASELYAELVAPLCHE